jgi:hypothetical protein
MTQTDSLQIDLNTSLEHLLKFLSERESDVIIRRFNINGKGFETLENIGKHFNITRERVRQIENAALHKLRRTIGNTNFVDINNLAYKILSESGGTLLESELVSSILKNIEESNEIDLPIICLSLAADNRFSYQKETHLFHSIWFLEETISLKSIQNTLKETKAALEKVHKLIAFEDLHTLVSKNIPDSLSVEGLKSIILFDKTSKNMNGQVGLSTWRFLCPKNIRDKAFLVLQKNGKPLHFVEIANRIMNSGFDNKKVTIQAVHNELIRSDDFALIGRGLYALKKWGYIGGTVAEVMEKILLKNEGPMKKKELVDKILSQHQVQIGTISLNLQKEPQFVRVGRAVYTVDMSKKRQRRVKK